MRGRKAWNIVASVAALGLLVACGGSTPPPETAESEEPVEAQPEPEPVAAQPEPEEGAEAPEEGSEPKAPAGEPEFKEGMTVEEAISAVPQGAARENVDQEALSRPLLESKLYEPCKPKPNQHFKVKVAVWDGRAVGIDVDTDPKNDKLGDCVKQQVATVQWKDKVKSLNIVAFSY